MHLVRFKQCEKWVQISKLTKGSLKSMGKAFTLQEVNGLLRTGIVHLCFSGLKVHILDRVETDSRRGETKARCHMNPFMD